MSDIKPALEKLRKVQETMQTEFEQGSDLYGRYLEEALEHVSNAIADLERPITHVVQEDGIRVLCSQCGKPVSFLRKQTEAKEEYIQALLQHIDWCRCKQGGRA